MTLTNNASGLRNPLISTRRTRWIWTHKAREKAKQLLIQLERAAQDRTLLVRMRAGLQQRIAEEQAKYASASSVLGQNQPIPPAKLLTRNSRINPEERRLRRRQ